jgi:hypothetical protein
VGCLGGNEKMKEKEKKIYQGLMIKTSVIAKLKGINANIPILFRTIINEASEEELENYKATSRILFRVTDEEKLKIRKMRYQNLTAFLEDKALEYFEKNKDAIPINLNKKLEIIKKENILSEDWRERIIENVEYLMIDMNNGDISYEQQKNQCLPRLKRILEILEMI